MSECLYPDFVGTTAYRKGCRCERCKAAKSEKSWKQREASLVQKRERQRLQLETEGENTCLFPENTPLTGYQKGCRCERCRAAAAESNRRCRAHPERIHGRSAKRATAGMSECPYPELAPSTAYDKRGCRCERCRTARSEIARRSYKANSERWLIQLKITRERQRLQLETGGQNICLYPEFAPLTGYSKGCRCDRCRDAKSEYDHLRREANPEYFREYHRRYHEENREQEREKRRQRRAENLEQERERDRRERGARSGFRAYAFLLPTDDTFHYIGTTTMSLKARLNLHIQDAKHTSDPRSLWLNQLQAEGLFPKMPLVTELENTVDMVLAERRLIVGLGKSHCPLLNFGWDWTTLPMDLQRVLAAHPTNEYFLTAERWWVYGLFDPRDGSLRYVGRTGGSLSGRLRHHLSDARKGVSWPCAAWIRELLDQGLKPTIVPLEEFAFPADMDEAEGRYIVGLGKAGHDLLNNGLDWLAPPIDPADLLAGKLSVEEILGRPATA